MHFNAKDKRGKRYHNYIVIEDSGKRLSGSIVWKCLCDCGEYFKVASHNFKNTKRCRKCRNEYLRNLNTIHGHSSNISGRSYTYYSWQSMKRRISEKRKGYENIEICERWMVFENFLEDMGERPEGMTLDRINGSKGYSPSNCRWATPKEQARNRKNKLNENKVKNIRQLIGKMKIKEIAKRFNVSEITIYNIKNNKIWIGV